MSGLLGFSRQAYYQHDARQFTSEKREQQVLALVAQVREEHPRKASSWDAMRCSIC
jgi:putative transposase